MMEEDFSTWTSCEMYGHIYNVLEDEPEEDACIDCGVPRDGGGESPSLSG